MPPLTDEQKDEVTLKIQSIYSPSISDPEDIRHAKAENVTRVLWFIDSLESEYIKIGSNDSPRVWKNLFFALDNEIQFRTITDAIIVETKKDDNNPEFMEYMTNTFENMLPEDANEGEHENIDGKIVKYGVIGSASAALVAFVAQDMILYLCPEKFLERLANGAERLCKANTIKVGGALASIILGAKAIHILRQYLKGEITGKRAGKKFADAVLTTAGGIAGAAGGAILGTLGGGPVGAVFGGLIGGTAGATFCSYLADFFTAWIFNIPREEALEDAYKYFGVSVQSTLSEINQAYYKKCRETHSDKGGSDEAFRVTVAKMQLIRDLRNKELHFWNHVRMRASSVANSVRGTGQQKTEDKKPKSITY